MIAQHQSKTNEHYTPATVVDAARVAMGGITLDPASCAEANKLIQAPAYYTKDHDGLARQWSGRVFLNPPGGLLRLVDGRWIVPTNRNPHTDKSSMWVWWNKLIAEYSAGRVTSAVFVGFTLEILRTSQSAERPVQIFPRCYPHDRLRFGGASPTHANVIVYLPPDTNSFDRFNNAFSSLGFCERGAYEAR